MISAAFVLHELEAEPSPGGTWADLDAKRGLQGRVAAETPADPARTPTGAGAMRTCSSGGIE